MAKPLNKKQLIDVANKEFSILEKTLAGLSPAQMCFRKDDQTWAVKDILAHLTEWQKMLSGWYESGLAGKTPDVPAAGYKWNQLPALNRMIFEKYRDQPLEEMLRQFSESHRKTLEWIETLSDADLTTAGLYPWMNKNTLLAYIHSATDAHYLWAAKEIKKITKTIQE